MGNSNHYLYNGNDWLVSQTDRNGSTTQFTHTPLGQVASMTDPLAGGWGFTYDLAGNTLTQTDPLGRITRNEYDAGNRLLRAYDANDNLTRVEYDLADNVTKHVDPLLRETLFQYDAWDRLTHATDALQATTVRTYDAVGNLVSLTDPLGGVTQFAYDALNRLTTSTDALGHVTTQAYDAAGNLQSVTDALGRVTTFGYDVLNRNTTVTNALGKTSSRAHDAVGNVTHETDALGRVTTHAYDGLHRLIKTTDPALGETTWTYDAAGNVLTVSNPLGEVQSLAYDALGRVVSSSSPGFGTSSTDYDAVGNVIQSTNALGQVTSTSYDNLNRPVTLTDALNQTSQWVYDDVGNVLQSIDPLGQSTSHSYDALNRLLTTTDALGHVTSYGYDSSGNRTSLTDSVGNETSWTYDAVGRVATETNQLGHVQSYTYDAVGNLARLTKRDGNQLSYTYDALNRRLTEAWETPAGALLETLHFVYDDAGQLTSAGDSQSTLVWSYDSLGRIVSETQNLDTGLEISLANAYDAAGRRTQLAASVNGVVDSLLEIDYYSGGLVHQMQHSGLEVSPKSVLYNYDVGGRTTSLHRYGDLANTELVAITEYEWDGLNRMQALEHTRAMTTFAGYDLVWDAASRLTSVDSLVDGLSEFAYDSVDQLISATYSNYANLSFSYDANGNRTSHGSVTGDDNQLLADSDATYDYDENGNLINRTDTSTGKVTEYSYDHRDRMIDVRFYATSGGNLTKHVQYRYDALNRRIAELVDTDGNGTIDDTTTIVNDGLRTDRGSAGDHVLLHLDENGDITNRYFHGAAVDEILAEENINELTGDSDVLWTLTDHRGSVRDLLRYDEATNTASVVDHVFFDAYGNIIADSNSNVDSLFGWTGREFDRHTGLQYSRARYYDSTTGRFTQKDPISFAAGDANLYRYVGNSPTNATDPSGLVDDRTTAALLAMGKKKEQAPTQPKLRSAPQAGMNLGDFIGGIGGRIQNALIGASNATADALEGTHAVSEDYQRRVGQTFRTMLVDEPSREFWDTVGRIDSLRSLKRDEIVDGFVAAMSQPGLTNEDMHGILMASIHAYEETIDLAHRSLDEPEAAGKLGFYGLMLASEGKMTDKVLERLLRARNGLRGYSDDEITTLHFNPPNDPNVRIDIRSLKQIDGTETIEVDEIIEHPGRRPFRRGEIVGHFSPESGNLDIEWVGVDEDFQLQGIGTNLYRNLVDKAGGKKVKTITGEMSDDNWTALESGGIENTPRVKILNGLGFRHHEFNPETRIMTSSR